MKLYYHPVSGYSQKVAMAFYEKEQAFEADIVNFFDEEDAADYREIHPLGKIPMLELESGELVWESSIIVEYLDTHFETGTRLIPEEKNAARRARFFERLSDLYVMASVSTIMRDPLKPEGDRDAKAVARARETLTIMFPLMNEALGQNTWALGETFSVADCAIAPALAYARKIHPYEQFTNLTAYAARIHERPSWQRVWQEAKPHFVRA